MQIAVMESNWDPYCTDGAEPPARQMLRETPVPSARMAPYGDRNSWNWRRDGAGKPLPQER